MPKALKDSANDDVRSVVICEYLFHSMLGIYDSFIDDLSFACTLRLQVMLRLWKYHLSTWLGGRTCCALVATKRATFLCRVQSWSYFMSVVQFQHRGFETVQTVRVVFFFVVHC